MAKNKTTKSEATSKVSTTPDTGTEVVETVETVARKAAEVVVEKVEAAAERAEAVVEKVEAVVERTAEAVAQKAEAVAQKAEEVGEKTAEAVKAQAVRTETGVTEAAGQMATFVKEHLELAQRQFGQLEAEAHKALETLVLRGRQSGREVFERLNVSRLRERPAVQRLEKQATWVGGEVRQRLTGLRSRMVAVVGGVASQSQVDALNRELDRLSRKLDALVPPQKTEPRQDTPEA